MLARARLLHTVADAQRRRTNDQLLSVLQSGVCAQLARLVMMRGGGVPGPPSPPAAPVVLSAHAGERSVEAALQFLTAGQLIVVPTDTLYGLACDATNADALVRLFAVKRRNTAKPVAISVGSAADIADWVDTCGVPAPLLDELLPGPVTVVLPAGRPRLHPLLTYEGKVGVRVPNADFIRAVSRSFGAPLALTSANLSGAGRNALSVREVLDVFQGRKVAAIFDDEGDLQRSVQQQRQRSGGDGGGVDVSRAGSTVVDLCGGGAWYSVVRPGSACQATREVLERYGLRMQGGSSARGVSEEVDRRNT